MSVASSLSLGPSATTARKSRRSQPKGSDSVPTTVADPNDSFTQQTKANQERHLKMEQIAQLQAQEQLHKARIQALFAQLQTQLFTIWNDIWMQRRKAHDEAFKAWMKILVA